MGGVNGTNPSSTQWLVRCQSLSKAKEIISGICSRHLCFLFCVFLAASISNVFFKMVFFFSIVCFEQIGESFLRNNIAFMIQSDLVRVLYRSQLAASTCACGCPSASQLLVSQFKTVGRFFVVFLLVWGFFLQKVCKESIVQQFLTATCKSQDPGKRGSTRGSQSSVA